MTNRDPKTAECWNEYCENKPYDDTYKNANGQVVGDCNKCKSTHVIVSAPKVKVKQEKDNVQK